MTDGYIITPFSTVLKSFLHLGLDDSIAYHEFVCIRHAGKNLHHTSPLDKKKLIRNSKLRDLFEEPTCGSLEVLMLLDQ